MMIALGYSIEGIDSVRSLVAFIFLITFYLTGCGGGKFKIAEMHMYPTLPQGFKLRPRASRCLNALTQTRSHCQ